ncbi:flavin reductase family protein [Streptomyces sp. NPDC020298]|uniref:flavin reductase family protein n=1 Tax=unclassified Streptomyces TaxID=2593676 RepID=UPI00341105BA
MAAALRAVPAQEADPEGAVRGSGPGPVPVPVPVSVPLSVPEEGATAAELLRRTLREHAAGVAVITVPGPAGFTATSFTSVSLEPALVTFFVGLTASTAAAVARADHFAVHLLGARNADLAARFAARAVPRFQGVDWSPSPEGVPLLQGVGRLTARTVLRQRVGDHLQVVGALQNAEPLPGHEPLIHHHGGYATATPLPGTGPGAGR